MSIGARRNRSARDYDSHREEEWPTQAMIRSMTAEIQKGWTEKERRKRTALAQNVELLQIHLDLRPHWSPDAD